MRILCLFTLGLILAFGLLAAPAAAAPVEPDPGTVHLEQPPREGPLGEALPLWSALPFLGILLSIAVFPLLAPVFWHHHFGKISLAWSVIFAVPFLIAYRGQAVYEILHIYLADYLPFIILLGGLFTVSGGILIRGTLTGTPLVNLRLLAIGTFLASLIGTTGASMLLIRPVIRANKGRKNKVHIIIFFIFLVSNIGGSLTPLGDPPLFLGFLRGVPFFWTLNLFPHMMFVVAVLLAMFFLMDTWLYRRERRAHPTPTEVEVTEPVRVLGLHNFLYLGGIIGAVLLSGLWKVGEFDLLGVHMAGQNVIRDVLIVLFSLLSLRTTRPEYRRDNGFTWFPIQEVAILFAGIFMTIIPALAMLKAGEQGPLASLVDAVVAPWQYLWATGILSGFLDNAPTYLTFFNLALGRLGLAEAQVAPLLAGAAPGEVAAQFHVLLEAISVGAVFFGAYTYIGNAPNFMVRSIAEENKIQMPSFFGFMAWSVAILMPLFLLVTLIFF